jgi:hypothetical protein
MVNSLKRCNLEKRRREALLEIHGYRQQVDGMVQRANACHESPDEAILTDLRAHLSAIEERAASKDVTAKELEELEQDAQFQSQLSAYICPRREVVYEGSLYLDQMEEWNLPKGVVAKLRATLGKKIGLADEDIESARSALRALFDEYDSWSDYTDDYEKTMSRYALWLVSGTVLALPAAIIAVHFAVMVPVAMLVAGLAGSFVSVLARMPALNVVLSGELASYLRKQVLIRVAVGVGASLVGCALLGWGVLSVSIQGQSFPEIFNLCTSTVGCSSLRVLILVAVPFLFGFSERGLTKLETRVFGK